MPPPGPIRKAWLRWKTLRLPWRKRFLVGMYLCFGNESYLLANVFTDIAGLDLQGNTYWEFKDVLSSKQGRMRRIVQYSNNLHYSDVTSKITPAWHQWLRHTRDEPPSLTEQSQDLVRQSNLKLLAAQADARWAAKPSYIDAPGKSQGQPIPAVGVRDPGGHTKSGMATEAEQKQGVRSPIADAEDVIKEISQEHEHSPTSRATLDRVEEERAAASLADSKKQENPWKKSRGGPSEEWQPQAWTPGSASVKR